MKNVQLVFSVAAASYYNWLNLYKTLHRLFCSNVTESTLVGGGSFSHVLCSTIRFITFSDGLLLIEKNRLFLAVCNACAFQCTRVHQRIRVQILFIAASVLVLSSSRHFRLILINFINFLVLLVGIKNFRRLLQWFFGPFQFLCTIHEFL